MKKLIFLSALSIVLCNTSFAEIYLFKKQYINKLKEVEIILSECLRIQDKKICNKSVQEYQKIKDNQKFVKFLSSNKCGRECKMRVFKIDRKNLDARMIISGVDINDIIEKLTNTDKKD